MATEPTAINITSQLVAVQAELKAPKSERNNFGNYNYRSAEDILEAVKPLLKKQGLAITLDDQVVEIAGRFYIKATVQVTNTEGQQAQATAFAREQEQKLNKDGRPTMDEAQITGSASSYARKYAMNGLFAIDDTKDADTQDNTAQAIVKRASEVAKNIPKRPATAPQKKMMFDMMLRLKVAQSEQREYLQREFGVGDELDMQTASNIIGALKTELGEE